MYSYGNMETHVDLCNLKTPFQLWQHEDTCTVQVASRQILLEIKMFLTNLLDKSKHIYRVQKVFSDRRSAYETTWKIFSTTGRAAADNTIGCMRFACC